MVQRAVVGEWVTRGLFVGLKWPKWSPPGPDPLTANERARILDRFRHQRVGFHPGRSSTTNRLRPHCLRALGIRQRGLYDGVEGWREDRAAGAADRSERLDNSPPLRAGDAGRRGW